MNFYRVLLVVFASLCAFSQAGAGNFSVSSVDIVMQARQPSYTLTVKNESPTDPLSLQVNTFSWDQSSGQDVYAATKDFVVTPRIFNVPPGGAQVVRLALRTRVELQQELSYRLFVTEVPDERPLEETGVRVALQLNIPIQILPVKTEPKSLIWNYSLREDNALIFRVSNPGNVRVKLTEMVFTNSASSTMLENVPVGLTLLPRASRDFVVSSVGVDLAGPKPEFIVKGVNGSSVVEQSIKYSSAP